MAEQKKAFDLGSALSKATMKDELSTRQTAGRVRTPSAFDEPLKKAWDAKKVLAFDLPKDAVDDALKEARAAARYFGFRLEVGQTENAKGMVTVELKPMPKRERKTKAQTEEASSQS